MKNIQPEKPSALLFAGILLTLCMPLLAQEKRNSQAKDAELSAYQVIQSALIDFDRNYRIHLAHEDAEYLAGRDYVIPVVIHVITGYHDIPEDLLEGSNLGDAFVSIQKQIRQMQPRPALQVYRKSLPGLIDAIDLASFNQEGDTPSNMQIHSSEELSQITCPADWYMQKVALLGWNSEEYLNIFVIDEMGCADILYSPEYRFLIMKRSVLEKEIPIDIVVN